MTAKNPLKSGAYVRCPRRHALIHAWIGPGVSPGSSGATSLRMECAHEYRHDAGWTSAPYYVELRIASAEPYPLMVVCSCDGGTSWNVDPRLIAAKLPSSGMVDVEVECVLAR